MITDRFLSIPKDGYLPTGQIVNCYPQQLLRRQLIADTDAEAVWHPSVKSRYGEVYFRKVFILDARPTKAVLQIASGGRTNIYINDKWIGEAKEWPEVDSFKVHSYMNEGRNLVAIQTAREPRTKAPPVLFLAITVETKFQ